jgi:hypothetical protein
MATITQAKLAMATRGSGVSGKAVVVVTGKSWQVWLLVHYRIKQTFFRS